MPKDTQILMPYEHSHYITVINDNTEVNKNVNIPVDPIGCLQVFASTKGRDGLTKQNTTKGYIDEYGKPNYHLYGQAPYMPYQALTTEQAAVWCLRVTAEDATYSNLMFTVKAKVDKTTDPLNPVLKVKHCVYSVDGVTDKEEFSQKLDDMANEDPDENGYIELPLKAYWMLGKGEYGKTYRVRLANLPIKDKSIPYKTYRLEILDSDGGIARKEHFEASLFEDAIVGNNTYFYEDVVNDSDTGSQKLNMYVNPYTIEKLFEMYKKEVKPDTELTARTFDVLFGKTSDNKANIPGYEVETGYEGFIGLDRLEGIPFGGGDDGAFKMTPENAEKRQAAIEKAILDGYKGITDPAIKSKRRVPAMLAFDANFPISIKNEMVNLAMKRKSTTFKLDAGLHRTPTQFLEFGNYLNEIDTNLITKDPGCYKTSDPFTGKVIDVTITYHMIRDMILHWKKYGTHIPYTGEYSKLTGHRKNSFYPVIDIEDDDIKALFFEQKMNYWHCTSENTFERAEQVTAQLKTSDLSEENNVNILMEAKEVIEDYVRRTAYNFAEKSDQQNFKKDASRILKPFLTKVRSIDVDFRMSDYEEEHRIIHCYLAMTMKSTSNKGITEIDINKRTSTY